MCQRRSSLFAETSFGLTAEYKRYLLEELFQLYYNGKMSLADAQRLPTYQRLWYIERTNNEIEAMSKEIEAAKKKGKRG